MQLQPLTQIPLYQNATVVRIKLTEQDQTRLSQLGLRCGATVKVLQTTAGTPLLLAIGDGRIGLNQELAEKVFVIV